MSAHSASVNRMTERIRRPRGSAVGNPVLYATVDAHAKSIVVDTADTLGITQARALELILLSLPLDRDGLPTTINRQAFARQEELPIPAA
jgi:hypothetical protein